MKRFILLFVAFSFFVLFPCSPTLATLSPTLSIIADATIAEVIIEESAIDRVLKMVDPPKPSTTRPYTVPASAYTSLNGFMLGSAAIGGLAFYGRTNYDPVYALKYAAASAADNIFIPGYQAFKANFISPETFPASAAQYVGVEAAIGISVSDMESELQESDVGLYSGLRNLFNGLTSWVYPNPEGSEVDMGGVSVRIPTTWNYQNYYSSNPTQGTDTTNTYGDPQGTYYATGPFSTPPAVGSLVKVWKIVYPHYVNGVAKWRLFYQNGTVVGNVTTSPTSSIDYEGLKNALSNPSPQIVQEIKDLIKNAPVEKQIVTSDPAPTSSPAPPVTAISESARNEFFTNNTTNIYNEYNNVANNSESTYNDIEAAKAAAETAKQQEEEKEEEEKFANISDNPFVEPYNPGEYDIPARFTSFLNTVKSSGLFSFSSGFFNSLPGGGSPVYEIEAGQYGHHTIDLSQTLSIGLAVLKTVLLACFGFLSIRAVIMKR
jgi:hypothetical protein